MKIGSYEIQVPFVTTSVDHLKTVIELSDIEKNERVVDLGSGDGRVLLEFAKHHPSLKLRGSKWGLITGYEIKQDLVERSRQRIVEANFQDNITIFNSSFWDADLSPFNIVYLYGMQSIMGRLEEKILTQTNPGTKIISNIFRFPKMKVKKEKNDVYLYII